MKHLRWAIAVTAVLGAVLAGGMAYQVSRDRGEPHPAIAVERQVRLGGHEMLSTAQAIIEVRNRGREALVISQIAKSCGCVGVSLESDEGQRTEVSEFTIPPLASAHLFVQTAVAGRGGIADLRTLTLRTNDPANPEVVITLIADAVPRYFASPSELLLGTVRTGEAGEREIDIMSLSPRLPPITRFTASGAGWQAEYLPSTAPPSPDGVAFPAGRLRVRFTAPTAPGEFEGALTAYCGGEKRPALTIQASGTVAHPAELLPQRVTLPRASGTGPIFLGSCLCRAAGKSLAVDVPTPPAGVTIRVEDVPDNPILKSIRVDASALRDQIPAEGKSMEVALVARVDGRRIPLTLVLFLHPTPATGDLP